MGCGNTKAQGERENAKPPASAGGGSAANSPPAAAQASGPSQAPDRQQQQQQQQQPPQQQQQQQPPQQQPPQSQPQPQSGAREGSPLQDEPEWLAAQRQCMVAPLMIDLEPEKDKSIHCISCCSGGGAALRFAIRTEPDRGRRLPELPDAIHTKAFTDEELTALRDGLQRGADGQPLDWKLFWKMLNAAFSTTSRVQVTNGGAQLDIKLKQSKEPKEQTMTIELQKGESTPAAVYEHFIAPFPRIYEARRKQAADDAKEVQKEKKELREADFVRAEADGSSRLHPWTVSESITLAAESAERRLVDVLPKLADEAKQKRRAVGKVQNQIAKLRQIQEQTTKRLGAAPHPLDKLYGCEEPADVEFGASIDCGSLGWDTDVDEMRLDLVDVAVALFNHHGIIEHFNMDSHTVGQFWSAVKAHCKDNPLHSARRATDMMCMMHHVLGRPDHSGSLANKVKMSKEDIFAALLSAGIVDVNHDGVTNAFVKRAGTMLSMLYSDLYQSDQDSLTVAFELMFNPHCNILKTLTPEQIKDVTETVREALFIKANVQMRTPMERFEDFRQLVASTPEWASKDNVRHAITHALRMCDFGFWGRPLDLHKKWMDRVREEFYLQGDKETRLGLAPSTFYDTQWTTARERDDSDFAAGQVSFIDSVVLPLFVEMQRLVPELESCVKEAKENRAHWEQAGGLKAGHFKKALQGYGKVFTETNGGGPTSMVVLARPGPDIVRPGLCLWISACGKDGVGYGAHFDEAGLSKNGLDLKALTDAFHKTGGESIRSVIVDDACLLEWGSASLSLRKLGVEEMSVLQASIKSTVELRRYDRMKDIERQLDKMEQTAKTNRDKALLLEGEARALRSCIDACNKQIEEERVKLEEIEGQLQKEAGGHAPIDRMKKMEREDALSIKVRNPLKAPLPPGVTKPPDCKDVDVDLLKLLKSKFFTKEGGAKADLDAPIDVAENQYVNVVQPMLTSEFCQVTKDIADPTRKKIFDLLKKLDDWDYDVFELQTAMSGGISGECMREQPNGGALFVTMYALVYKWQFMQKFNINEQVLLNWLSIVEAGYHPNPYHNSMHAADVLHVTHYIIQEGGLQKKIRATDEEVFAALFAATVHDYNHPGINNAFHVRSQNYLAVLFNDRSVNENIHASSVFELMRMDEFNVLKAFKGQEYTRMRDDIVEFILGTDMGLHAMFVSRFKKRLEQTDSKMHRTKPDRNLALTMAVKMADISNCGRPKKLYHGWCNVIVDEFFQQGDRERLQGMPVSPFMDRYTTVMSKGQIGFMNYIVMPLFECMGEYLEEMHMATAIAEENKGFWQDNEDW